MRHKLFSLAIGAAILQTLVTLPARAETVDFAAYENTTPVYLTVLPYPTNPEELSALSSGGQQFFVGLTQGILTIGGTVESNGLVDGGNASSMFYMYCVDFNNEISVPTSYLVNVDSLATGSFTGDPGLKESLSTLQLQMTLGAGFGVTPSGNASVDGPIQEDIWNLSSTGAFAPATSQMMLDLNNATAAAKGGDFSNGFLFDTASGQAFMPVDSAFTTTTGDNPVTPEPATFGLMALALAGLGIGSRRKKTTANRRNYTCL